MYQSKARQIVRDYANSVLDKSDLKAGVVKEIELDDVYIVWFSKTLQNWKALVSTTLPDLKYYEVTYNGDDLETYLDVYVKVHNETLQDFDAEVFEGTVPAVELNTSPVVAGEEAHDVNDNS